MENISSFITLFEKAAYASNYTKAIEASITICINRQHQPLSNTYLIHYKRFSESADLEIRYSFQKGSSQNVLELMDLHFLIRM